MTDFAGGPQLMNRSVPPTTESAGSPQELSFEVLFRSEYSYVIKTLRRLSVDAGDIEDVANDVFLTVHRRLADYDRTRPLKPWLFGIAFRIASDYRRLTRHHREVSRAEVDAVDEAPSAEERLATRDAQRLVMRALERIDFDRRSVFIMSDIDELPMPAIALELGIPLNTAYSRLRLARAEFGAAVQRLKLGER